MHEACNVGDGKEGGMGVSRFPDIDEVFIAFIWKSTSGLIRVDGAKGAVLHRAVAERYQTMRWRGPGGTEIAA